MIETLALVMLIAATIYVMRSARRRRYPMLERADYVDVASVYRVQVKKGATLKAGGLVAIDRCGRAVPAEGTKR